MRYIGLVVGMMLLSNQAFAETYTGSKAEKIITSGKIIHMQKKDRLFDIRVIYKGKYYHCYDFLLNGELNLTCITVD